MGKFEEKIENYRSSYLMEMDQNSDTTDDSTSNDPQSKMKKKKIKELDKKITDEKLKDKEEELKSLKTN